MHRRERNRDTHRAEEEKSSILTDVFKLRWCYGFPGAHMKIEAVPGAPQDGEFEFVLATEKEFEEIISISHGIYGGLDYLPSRYHSWINEKDRMVVLAKKGGTVIGLLSVFVVDGGETALLEGLRVAPWERGRGVAGVLQRFCCKLVKHRYPSVKVMRLTRDDKLSAKELTKYRVIAKQGILLVSFNAPDLASRIFSIPLSPTDTCPPPPILLTPEDVRDVFLERGGLLKDLLPNQTIIQDWQPFQAVPDNQDLLRRKSLRWMSDDLIQPQVATLCTAPFPVPAGPLCFYLNIDVFGSELQSVQEQLLSHLRAHVPKLPADVRCQLFLPPNLWRPMADFCTLVLGLHLEKGYTEQYLLEADI
ncbi:histidine N-acetyltransferase [Xenopus laevis]|uniref:Histidine N-acetyltransferase n=1 Tax=Xenopus laevis TaxID=8355 RepID=A0A8J0U3A8_XENLA|nr:histidine N-acetyltransferase [Xenopus laevis]XP_041444872.1 histidine N-acetyltransferase [Xenopus laevis]